MPWQTFNPYDLLGGETGLVNSHSEAEAKPERSPNGGRKKSKKRQRKSAEWKAKQGAFKADYMAYVNSPEWKEKRKLVLKRDGYCCRKCSASYKNGATLQVHHLTYERFKNEDLADLITLCVECHKETHGIK